MYLFISGAQKNKCFHGDYGDDITNWFQTEFLQIISIDVRGSGRKAFGGSFTDDNYIRKTRLSVYK